MKLHVLFDKDGAILAAVQVDAAAAVRARPTVDAQAGQRVAEVHVPAEYRHLDLAAVCQRLKVDVSGKFANLKA
jgi:hypothetical protein